MHIDVVLKVYSGNGTVSCLPENSHKLSRLVIILDCMLALFDRTMNKGVTTAKAAIQLIQGYPKEPEEPA